MNKISILGAGAFGFAMAKLVAENQTEKEIYLYDVVEHFINHINETRKHPVFHKDIKLPKHINATLDVKKAVKDADLIILAIPSKFLRTAVRGFREHLRKDTVFLNLAKGLEAKTNKRVSEILDEELTDTEIKYEKCCLSGGMIASEVTLNNPLCAELACKNRSVAKNVAKLLWSDYFRIETTTDLIGIELAGAFKNVVAIGGGIFDGLGYGESSKSAFVSSAARQMRRLAVAMGADRKTFGPGSQAWFGDLMTTCFGDCRNREYGELIGKGMSARQALDDMLKRNRSVEGYITTEVVHSLIKKHNVDAPLIHGIHNVLYKGEKPEVFVKRFIKDW